LKFEKNEATTYTILKPEKKEAPKIIFASSAIKWIEALVDVHSDEVGFFGIVDERGNDTYFIREIFYPKHSEANGGTCEISTEGESDMGVWLINRNREDDIGKVRFWGHSHHTMGVSPSQQDEDEAIEKMNRRKTYFLRGICNKKEIMSVSFFDYNQQIKFDNVKWTVEEDGLLQNSEETKLKDVALILSTDNIDTAKKIQKIEKVIKTNNIKKKVKELKKINLPEEDFTNYKSYSKKNGKYKNNLLNYQEDLFKIRNEKLNKIMLEDYELDEMVHDINNRRF